MNKSNPNKFNAASPGFLYSVVVFILTALAAAGVSFPQTPDVLGQELLTTLSGAGIFSVVGVIVSSLIFPIWNAYKKGFTWKNVWTSSLTWIGLANIVFSAIALTGFTLPDGTVDQLVLAIIAKDWTALGSMIGTVVFTSFLRWLKDRNTQPQKN